MYCYGEGMEKDFAKGAKWLTKAALQGNAPAQYNLGRMYQWGKGVEKDLQQARFWFQKAIDNGHEKAKEALTKIKATYPKKTLKTRSCFPNYKTKILIGIKT